MAGFQESDKRLFPLNSISSIVRLFKRQLEISTEPDLALLSIIAGAVENSLTCNRVGLASYSPTENIENDTTISKEKSNNESKELQLPAVQYYIVEALYSKFHTIIKGAVDLSQYGTGKYASRELVKKVSDVIWNSLTRSYYKDRAHLQSLFVYLTGNKLDCFGVAFAVVAAFQVLGYSDVHLALSEDHSWVVFGEGGSESAEVTWHGKGTEDKRGQPITPNSGSMSWLYLNGSPVICTRSMEVAALVSAINPSQSATTDVMEVAMLQKELLWLLYDLGHLACYPMALGNLGDLEEISHTPGRPPCVTLFHEAALSCQTYYNNQHVYPYTYQGGYFYRQMLFKDAFESWANASDVIRLYNYSRDDEEIYKEFLEIANDLIPYIMKVVSSGHSAHSILKDPECFAHLLRFYDGICQWEEGSATPVLHIGWAKPLVNTISKFDAEVRAKVIIEDDTQCDEDTKSHTQIDLLHSNKDDGPRLGQYLNNNNCCKNRECKPAPKSILSDIKREEAPHPSIAALTMACGETILNREYLLGGREPFVGADVPSTSKETPVEPEPPLSRPRLTLHSQKMKGLKDLLLAEKLNTHAISLQLTAQSQTQVGKRCRSGSELNTELPGNIRPKRKATNRD